MMRAFLASTVAATLVAATLVAAMPGGVAMATPLPPTAPMAAPGGELDPAFPQSDVYIGMPRAAPAPVGPACTLAARYVELVNAGRYAAVAALFADDATFLEPMRPSLRGRAEIDAFYTRRIGTMQPQVLAVRYFGGGGECMVELALRTQIAGKQRYVLVSVDHFILGADGKVQSMVAFARPPRATGG